MNIMERIYIIIRNKTNEVIFASTDYDIMKQYVKSHFPNYTINEKYHAIFLHSNNFTLQCALNNYDYYEEKDITNVM